MQSTDAKKGGSADYTVTLDKTASEFYSTVKAVSAATGQIVKDWVGYGDESDYQAFSIGSAAKLSFSLSSTDAVRISVCALVENKGAYSFKSLQQVAAKYDKNTKKYVVDTNALLLEKGTYYLCVQSTNAKKAGTKADYTVSLNKTASVFYTKGVNTDDWDDLKTKGAAGKVGKKIAAAVTASSGQLLGDWVGYGDEYDYQAFTLNSAANLSLTITATDATKFTICALQSSTDKKGVTTYSLKKLQQVSPKYDKSTGKYTVDTKALLLDKGTYYLCAQSTNAGKGGSADYTVSLNKTASEFFTKGSSNDNNWDSCPVLNGTLSYGELEGSFSGWVGYGDPVDYRTFTTNAGNGGGGYYIFDLELTGNSVNNLNFAVYEIVDNKGVKSLKKLKGATATASRNGVVGVDNSPLMLKSNTKYVVGVENPNAKSAKNSSYKLTVYQDQFAHFNMANNERTKATVLNPYSGEIFNTLTKSAGGDSVDWYDISAFNGNEEIGLDLLNTHESMALKLTFYTGDMVETKVWVQDYSNNRWSEVSTKGLNTRYGVYCYFGDAKGLKYLKVEANSTARNSYVLAAY